MFIGIGPILVNLLALPFTWKREGEFLKLLGVPFNLGIWRAMVVQQIKADLEARSRKIKKAAHLFMARLVNTNSLYLGSQWYILFMGVLNDKELKDIERIVVYFL